MGEVEAPQVVSSPWHPALPFVLSLSILVFTMAAFEPVCTALALGGSLLYVVLTRGIRTMLRSLAWQLPLVVIICLINPLFTGLGSTLLLTLGRRRVYLESLIFGLNMGCMLVASFTWLFAFGVIVDSETALDAIGRPLPVVALMISMSLRMVPLFVRRGYEMADLQAVNTAASKRSGVPTQLVRHSRQLTSLVGWGLEDSFELSDSMIARGWTAGGRRSSYRRERFRMRDGIALAGIFALVIFDIWGLADITGSWHYYPALAELSAWWLYLPHMLVMLLPSVVHIVELICWRLREVAA